MAVYNISSKYNSNEKANQNPIGFVSLYETALFDEALLLPPVDIRLQSNGNKLYFNGENSYNFRYNPRTTKVPLLPELKQNIIEISGKNGGYDFGTEYGNRVITIDLWSDKNLSISQIVEQKNFLRDFFVLGDTKKFTSERNNSQVYYNVKLYKNIEFVEYAGWFQTIISLIAVDAYGYEITNISNEAHYSSENLVRTITIANYQNTENGFTIAINGALYDPIIKIKDPEISVTGVSDTVIELTDDNKQINAGETILIDMAKMIAVKTTSTTRTNALTLFKVNNDIFTKIKPNSTRDIEITFSSEGTNNGSVGVFYVGYGI